VLSLAFQTKTVWFVVMFAASLIIILALLAIPAGLSIVKFPLVILALLFDLLAFSTRYFSYLFGPVLKMKKGFVTLDGEEAYTLAPSSNAILVREGSTIYATSFVKIPVYISATEMEPEDKLAFTALFGRILSLSNDPVKLSSELYIINKDQYIESIKLKLNKAEDKYNELMSTINTQGNESKDSLQTSEADRMRGELTMWKNMLDSVSKARSQTLVTYAAVTAQGTTEEEAINLSLTRADDFAAGVSAVLGITASVAVGLEILPFIEPDAMIPVTNVSERLKAKSAETGGS
jgi:hypothetical protein